MNGISNKSGAKQVCVYFYGSFIRRDVMKRGGFSPASPEGQYHSGANSRFFLNQGQAVICNRPDSNGEIQLDGNACLPESNAASTC